MNPVFAALFLTFAQISVIPGSSARGAELFREKTCLECHAGNVPHAATPTLLATALWNHSPKMWRAQQDRNVRPMLDSFETADLFAYFFSLAYFTAPGNAMRGRTVFENAGCAGCHETVAAVYDRRNAGAHRAPLQAGPPISTWSEVSDPLAWAERMWNHSATIYRDASSTGRAWPSLSTSDMLDLLSYLRVQSSPVTFQPGDPELGRVTFESTCESCHSFGSRTTVPKIDLLKKPASDQLTGYVTAMWNHAPVMRERAGNAFPILGPGDMSNLVAYLFAQRYFEDEGDVERGARVFESKNCTACHESRKERNGAPDLSAATERYSPITMAAAVWRHGPKMLETMQQHGINWPHFSGREMSDLIAFLNKRLIVRVGGR
jgi:cytochrome c2